VSWTGRLFLEQVKPEPNPAGDEDEAAQWSQWPGPFLRRIEREDIKAAREKDDANEPADDRSALRRPALADSEQSQRMDPLVKKSGMPEIKMILPVKKIVDRTVGREGAEDDAKQAEKGPKAQRETIGMGCHAEGRYQRRLKVGTGDARSLS
jgi:hypothetical protein